MSVLLQRVKNDLDYVILNVDRNAALFQVNVFEILPSDFIYLIKTKIEWLIAFDYANFDTLSYLSG